MNLNNLILKITPAKTFIILSFIFGVILTFIIPPFQVADEQNHFFRIYQLSEFEIVGKKQGNSSGGYVPDDIVNMSRDLQGYIIAGQPLKFPVKKLNKYWNKKTNFENKQFIDFRNTVLYSPIVYVPQVVGFKIAKFINYSPLLMIYFGRLFNLFVFIALSYCAIKLTPIYKWGFVMLALMPMTIYQASSLSADSLCTGMSFLFIAFILNCALLKQNITNKNILTILLMAVILGLCKSAYFFLIFLFLIIPIDKFKSKIKYFTSFFLITAISAIISIIWSFIVNSIYIPVIIWANPHEQLISMITNPQNFIIAFINSILNFGILPSFVGNLGWMDSMLPLVYVFMFLSVLLSVAFFEDGNNIYLNLRQKITIFMTLLLNLLLIQALLYLSCNQVGTNYFMNQQGRYFIPIAPLFLLCCYNKFTSKSSFINKGGNLFLACFITFMLLVTLVFVICRYYIE